MDDGCHEALERLERYLDGECPDDMEAIVTRHLADCQPCLDRTDFERSLRALVARHCREAAPAGLLHRVLEQLS